MAESGGGGTSLVDEFKRNRHSELSLEIVEGMASLFQNDLDKEVDIRDVSCRKYN